MSTFSAGPITDVWAWFLGRPVQVVLLVVVAALTRAILVRIVRRAALRAAKLARSGDAPADATRREQRADSVSQLLDSIITIGIWAIAVVTLLAIFGVNIGPIVASAGVVGVALGFGAQTLVKDYIAGIFMVLEDQFSIGDLVDVGPVVGNVEEVGLRITRLRDLSGVVWYVRNGEILRVANRSQGWTMAVVDVPVDYDSDLAKVRAVVDEVAEAMAADPTCAELILDAPEYAGVESVSGEAVVIRITARALPEMQVPAAREIRARVKQALDAAGVKVPVVLRFPKA